MMHGDHALCLPDLREAHRHDALKCARNGPADAGTAVVVMALQVVRELRAEVACGARGGEGVRKGALQELAAPLIPPAVEARAAVLHVIPAAQRLELGAEAPCHCSLSGESGSMHTVHHPDCEPACGTGGVPLATASEAQTAFSDVVCRSAPVYYADVS